MVEEGEAKGKERQYDKKVRRKKELNNGYFVSVSLFLRLTEVPISNLAVEWPDFPTCGSLLMLSGHSDFGRACALNLRFEHPDLFDLDSLLVKVTANCLFCGCFIESID